MSMNNISKGGFFLFGFMCFSLSCGMITETRKPKKENSKSSFPGDRPDLANGSKDSSAAESGGTGLSSTAGGTGSGSMTTGSGTSGGGTSGGGSSATGANCKKENQGPVLSLRSGKNGIVPPISGLSFDDSKSLWILHENGVSQLNKGKWTQHLPKINGYPEYEKTVIETGGAKAFVGGTYGIYAFDGSKWNVLTNYLVANVLYYTSKGLWIGHGAGGNISIYNNKGLDFIKTPVNLKYHGSEILDIIEAPGGAMYISTNKGLISYSNKKFSDLGQKEIISNSLAHDGAKLWAATAIGLQRLSSNSWSLVPINGNSNKVNDLALDSKGGLWALEDNRLAKLDQNKWKVVDHKKAFPSSSSFKKLLTVNAQNSLYLYNHEEIVKINTDCFSF